ncbi:MAG: FadR/GntR family transcriptional regulator [Myxococcota bacterium]|nr:FadR/GntR family transcriptional regulator [Myxococcota bacterium]
MMDFKPIKQVRIYEEVVQQLKAAILGHRYSPGEKLPSERQLCQQFQVSRVVIREAIRVLELTGFVTLRQGPSGGAYVRDLSYEYLSSAYKDLFLMNKLSSQEVVDVRLHIEPEIARIAAQKMTPEAKKELTAAYLEEQKKTNNQTEWVHKNLKIHRLLAGMTGNRLYEAILNPLLDLMLEMILAVKAGNDVIHHEHTEHEEIINAVISADPQTAANAMCDHINNIGSLMVELEASYRKKMGLL